jgi:DNA-binding transcriptional LysR family regulator
MTPPSALLAIALAQSKQWLPNDLRPAQAAGAQTRWGRRRNIKLAELAAERWVLAGPETWNYAALAEAFAAQDLEMPKITIRTLSVHIRANLLARDEFITALPRSVLHLYAERFGLKALPVDVPLRPWPVILLSLKNRTVTPVVERFVDTIREIGKMFEAGRFFAPTRARSRSGGPRRH